MSTGIFTVGMTNRNSHRQGAHQGEPCRAVILMSIMVQDAIPERA
jgi:hypothetical protein